VIGGLQQDPFLPRIAQLSLAGLIALGVGPVASAARNAAEEDAILDASYAAWRKASPMHAVSMTAAAVRRIAEV
jgi:hypothetical protein